jgi:hypothetical protein
MHAIIARHVSLAHPCSTEGSYGRLGTAVATRAEVEALFGPSHITVDGSDDKVRFGWYIKTPRGTACLRDYWWNLPNELTIAGPPRACMWVAAYFRSHGITAKTRNWRDLSAALYKQAKAAA